MKIHYITKHPSSIRAGELSQAATELEIDFEITSLTSVTSSLYPLSKLIDGDAVMWNSADVPKGHHAYSVVTTFLHYAHEKIILNKGYITQPLVRYKYYQYALASSFSGPQMVPTYVGNNVEEVISQNISFPVICKPSHGSEGKGIVRCDTKDELRKADIPFESYIIQPYVENNGDNRILTFGGIPFGMVRRVGTSYLHNLSLGGTAQLIKDNHEKIILQNIASAAATLFQIHIAGVDVMCDIKEQTYYLQEINTTPQWQGAAKVLTFSIPKEMLMTAVYLHKRKTTPVPQLVKEYYALGSHALGDEHIVCGSVLKHLRKRPFDNEAPPLQGGSQEILSDLNQLFDRTSAPFGGTKKNVYRGIYYLCMYILSQKDIMMYRDLLEQSSAWAEMEKLLRKNNITTDNLWETKGAVLLFHLFQRNATSIELLCETLINQPLGNIHMEVLFLLSNYFQHNDLTALHTQLLNYATEELQKGLSSYSLESLLCYALEDGADQILRQLILDRSQNSLSPLGNFITDLSLPEQHHDNSFIFSTRRSMLYLAVCQCVR